MTDRDSQGEDRIGELLREAAVVRSALPPVVEAELRAAFRAARPKRSRFAWPESLTWLSPRFALVAALVAAAGLGYLWRENREMVTPVTASPAIARTATPAQDVPAAEAPAQLATVLPGPTVPPRPAPRPRAARGTRTQLVTGEPREVYTGFFALDPAVLMERPSGVLVRVRVPQGTMAAFGLPLSADAPDRRVEADVLMANDGTARAIRFVRTTYQ
jgi:hypothetical protein